VVLFHCLISFSSILIPILLSIIHVMQFLSCVKDSLDSFALRKLVDPRKLLLKGICPINYSHEEIVDMIDKLH
jgi:hypothetical protein